MINNLNWDSIAPLVIFAYNRIDHISKCLEAIDNNIGASNTILYIFSDGYKNEDDKVKVDGVRKKLHEFKQKNNFRRVIIEESEVNKGLAASVKYGVSKVLDEYESVIVVEDDLIASKDFLIYMNDALCYYEKISKVWSISGYTPNFKALRTYDKDVYMCERGCSWGWATWRDRWVTIDWTLKDYNTGKYGQKQRRKFKKVGFNLPELLDYQMAGKIDSWAIVFCYEEFKQGKYTVYPTVSRIKNIGMDGSGTHHVSDGKWQVTIADDIQNCLFIDPVLNRTITRGFYYFYVDYLPIRVAKTIWKWLKELIV